MIDFRSDTVTKPTPAMREAMYNAEVGDDGYGDDPSVNALEELAAAMTGKEAALYVPTGTMGNQIAIALQVRRGTEVICDAEAHVFLSENGGISAHGGAQAFTVNARHGILTPEEVEAAIRPNKMNVPRTALIEVENTHNHAGGTYYTTAQLAAIKQVAEAHALPVHMDGARIFNAAVAQGEPVKNLCQYADTVQFCLSKGLCAPVGSMLVGKRDFINAARHERRLMGGGMRQAGIIAAAGLVALNTMVDRLAEDHEHAQLLANAIANTKLGIDMSTVQTNILMCDTAPLGMSAAAFISALGQHGIKANEYGPHKVRMVTHHDIKRQDIELAMKVIAELAR